jgi:hypothetical protein
MQAPLTSFEVYKTELSVLIRTRVKSVQVDQNEGRFKQTLKFRNGMSLQLMDTGRYKEIEQTCKIVHILEVLKTSLSCVDLTWNNDLFKAVAKEYFILFFVMLWMTKILSDNLRMRQDMV